MTRYGYAAMNVTLREEDDVRTNRGMQKATFEERGLEYAGELAEQNCRGLKRVVEWNLNHDTTIIVSPRISCRGSANTISPTCRTHKRSAVCLRPSGVSPASTTCDSPSIRTIS